jgi:ferritin-like metal-binding protein YciE
MLMPSKKPKGLDQLYYEELRDLYDAENRLVRTLPKLAKASSADELEDAFTDHLEKTRGHVERLNRIFESMGKKASAKTCNGIRGIIEEGSEILELESGPVRDAGLIAGAQRAEHYEIAAYGTVRTWAQQLNRQEDVDFLQQTLDEEKEADKKLTEIAEASVNIKAEEEQQTGERMENRPEMARQS